MVGRSRSGARFAGLVRTYRFGSGYAITSCLCFCYLLSSSLALKGTIYLVPPLGGAACFSTAPMGRCCGLLIANPSPAILDCPPPILGYLPTLIAWLRTIPGCPETGLSTVDLPLASSYWAPPLGIVAASAIGCDPASWGRGCPPLLKGTVVSYELRLRCLVLGFGGVVAAQFSLFVLP